MQIGIIGCGKLGLGMVAFYASKGNNVHAIDTNENIIKSLSKYQCHIQEPYVANLITKHKDRITCGTGFGATKHCEISFVIVPTPTDKTGEFDNSYILKCLPLIQSEIIVIVSTVKLGSMREFSKLTDKKLLYSPEFVALGSIIQNMSKPDAILIGEKEDNTLEGITLSNFFCETYEYKVPISRMTWENAEVAKLALNTTITTKITLANTLTEVCQTIPGGNIDKITEFLGNDSRIGKKYLSGGLSFGGCCFPRDNIAFSKMGSRIGVDTNIQGAVQYINKAHNKFVVKQILNHIDDNTRKISLLGISYKPDTPIIEESAALEIIKALSSYNLSIYDSLAKVESNMASSIEDCLIDSDLAIIATQDKAFKKLPIDLMRRPIIFDCWRWLDKSCLPRQAKYFALGINNKE